MIQLGIGRPEVFYKKGIIKNFAKFTGKHLCQSLFFNKVTRQEHLFYKTPTVAASRKRNSIAWIVSSQAKLTYSNRYKKGLYGYAHTLMQIWKSPYNKTRVTSWELKT